MIKQLRFIRVRKLMGVRKAPGPKGSTIWLVYSSPSLAQILKGARARNCLGRIYWFSRWRRYAFFPDDDTAFEWNCQRTIADFCESETMKLKRGRK